MKRNIGKMVDEYRKTFGSSSKSKRGKFYEEDLIGIVDFVKNRSGKVDLPECVITALEVGVMTGYNARIAEEKAAMK